MKRFSLSVFVATLLLSVVALGAMLLASGVAGQMRAQSAARAGALTVRVLAPQDGAALARAATALRRMPGVSSATPIDAAHAARLLESRGGGPVDPADMPPLFLIEAQRAPAIATDARIDQALRAAGVSAELYHEAANDIDRRPAQAEFAGAAAAALLLLAMACMHGLGLGREPGLAADLGAPRGRTLATHGRAAFTHGFAAGALGALLTAAAATGVLMSLSNPLSLVDMAARISASDTALVLLAPLAAALAAALGARFGAARGYDRADRLG